MLKGRLMSGFVSALFLFILSSNLLWAGEKLAILEGLAKSGSTIAFADDGQLDKVRAKGQSIYLNLSAANVNKVYTFYDANYNYLGGASWHSVLGIDRSVNNTGNVDYYYANESVPFQLYRIDWNAQRIFVNQSGRVINWAANTYVGLYGNFGNVAGATVTNLPTPTTGPINIMLY